MNQTSIRIGVDFEGIIRKAFIVSTNSNQKGLLYITLLSFNIPASEHHDYVPIITSLNCVVESAETLMNNHILSLEKASIWRPIEDSDYLYKGKVTSDNEDENAVRNKEVTSIEMYKEESRKDNDFIGGNIIDDKKDHLESSMIYQLDDENAQENYVKEIDKILFEVSIDHVIEASYNDREDLKNKLTEWASQEKITLNLKTAERENKKSGNKISSFFCSKKATSLCPFYLEFQTDDNENYALNKYYNNHNHQL